MRTLFPSKARSHHWLLPLLVMAINSAASQTDMTKTRTLAPTAAAATGISICNANWIAGHWLWGEGATQSEEIWAPAIGATIMGSFRAIRDGKVAFYEIMLITEEGGSLVLRLRHFHPDDLRGWEQEQGVAAVLRLAHWDDRALYFDGVTFELAQPDLLRVHVRSTDAATGKVSEKHFDYRKLASLPEQPCQSSAKER